MAKLKKPFKFGKAVCVKCFYDTYLQAERSMQGYRLRERCFCGYIEDVVPWPFTTVDDVIDVDLTALGFEITIDQTYADYLDQEDEREAKENGWGESYDW